MIEKNRLDLLIFIQCIELLITQIKLKLSNHVEKYLQNTKDNMAISLIKMFRLGPDVSLRGSPTVSPTTAAL